LIRSVGELGDWGYFPTPEAQCLGEHTFNYGVAFHGAPATRYATYQRAQTAQFDFVTSQVAHQEGTLANHKQYVTIAQPNFAVTALKRSDANELIVRGYNLTDEEIVVPLKKADNQTVTTVNLLEEELGAYEEVIKPFEIRTVRIETGVE
jgi:Alpha-mannosidase